MTKKSFNEIKKYDTFIFDKFNIIYNKNDIEIEYYYEIKNLKKFIHKLIIPYTNNNLNKKFIEKLAFNIGLLEIVSYWKSTISPNIIINCGNITNKQKEFFKKLYYRGLSEFFYLNNLEPDYNTFVTFKCNGPYYNEDIDYSGSGSLVAIGGGKDSCVTLSIYPKEDVSCFMVNPKEVMLNCAYAKGIKDDQIYKVQRMIDKGLLELNEEGFLNGHTPFSAMIAFVSFLTIYLNNKERILVSNESSANEANIKDTNINHQYSKSYEFEKDFQDYAKEFLNSNIKYYSFLRPLSEYQIAMLFAKKKEYHQIFKSCNIGSKKVPWNWCCNCSKCLFVYSLLSPFLYEEDLINIFGEDLFKKEDLLNTFIDLIGKGDQKPFECVGTFEEINYAITKTISKLSKDNLPYLLDYYYHNYYDENILKKDLEHQFNNYNNLPEDECNYIKEIINNDK